MRELTATERAVLADVVISPDEWWAHVNSDNNKVDPESALAQKITRWRPDFEARLLAEGELYKTRAEREVI